MLYCQNLQLDILNQLTSILQPNKWIFTENQGYTPQNWKISDLTVREQVRVMHSLFKPLVKQGPTD